MPRSIAASTVRRNARVPSRWPSATGRPRDIAQRPFPSRMIATQRTGPAGCSSRCCFRKRSSRPTGRAGGSDLQNLFLFLLQEVVDLVRVVVGQLLHPFLGAALLVAANLALIDELLQVMHDVTADVADGYAAFLRHLLGDLDELLPPLLRQLRDRQPDELAGVGGRQPQVGFLNGPLDRPERAWVEGLDGQQSRLGRVD